MVRKSYRLRFQSSLCVKRQFSKPQAEQRKFEYAVQMTDNYKLSEGMVSAIRRLGKSQRMTWNVGHGNSVKALIQRGLVRRVPLRGAKKKVPDVVELTD